MRASLLICFGFTSLFYGAYCLVVSSWAVETPNGYFVGLFHATFKIDDHGMLGDDGTFRTELAMKGILFTVTSFGAFIHATKIIKLQWRRAFGWGSPRHLGQ
jgi:hypothetical protein